MSASARLLQISEFLLCAKATSIIDVRTPAEFEAGHIPGAINVPLFTNEERALVGTLYKQQGSQTAIKKGLELVGPKLNLLIDQITPHARNNEILIHCWRGGMRSSSVAWLMEISGLKATTLKGGYKAFRAVMRQQFEKKYELRMLGGCTGSGKSYVLHELKKRGETIIDLEALACHKGSSFGHLGEKNQVTQEMFENQLGWILYSLPPHSTIWVEDESRMIGKKHVPESFYRQMIQAPVFVMDIPAPIRAQYLTREYGKFAVADLIEATQRIEKRLGPQQCKEAVEHIKNGNLLESCKISLVYYDKAYKHGLGKRNQELVFNLPFAEIDYTAMAECVIQQSKKILHGAR